MGMGSGAQSELLSPTKAANTLNGSTERLSLGVTDEYSLAISHCSQ